MEWEALFMERNTASSIFSFSHQEQIHNNILNIFKCNLRDLFANPKVRNNFSSNYASGIDSNALYTISAPAHLADAYNRGNLHWVIGKKNGLPTGQLADKQGKFRGVGILKKATPHNTDTSPSVVSKNRKQTNAQHKIIVHQLNQIKLQNVAIMQRLMQITEIVSDIRSRVISLQKLHDTDLVGGIVGTRDLLLQIKDPNDLAFQKSVLASAINDLNRDRGKIQQELISLLEEMPSIPPSGIGRFFKIMRDSEFCSNVAEKHHRIQWLFSLYLTATTLLGYAYAVVGENRAYARVFTPAPELMNNANLVKLVNAEKMFVTAPEDAWYKNTDEYLGKLGKATHKVFAENSARQIKLTGVELQEVLSLETAE